MLNNNESGSLQPVENVAERFHEFQVLLHNDVAQVARKIPVDLRGDLRGYCIVTLVSNIFGAPKGIYALYIRPGCLTKKGRRYLGL